MNDIILQVQKTFEDIKLEDETGFEFWSARDLMWALGYSKWQRFEEVITKAKSACDNSGNNSQYHFLPEPVKTSAMWGRPGKDYLLTRYACYLIAQNGDSRLKSEAKKGLKSQTKFKK
jgi:DNA-damage-inducible protein D